MNIYQVIYFRWFGKKKSSEINLLLQEDGFPVEREVHGLASFILPEEN